MARHVPIDRRPKWLAEELARTGLPKSALAGYLAVSNSAVSRLVGGGRFLKGSEAERARRFFEVAPPSASAEFVAATRKLRSEQVRMRVGRRLLELALDGRAIPPCDDASRGLDEASLRRAASPDAPPMRADQLVALCALLGEDLPEVVRSAPKRGGPPLRPPQPSASRNALSARASEPPPSPFRADVSSFARPAPSPARAREAAFVASGGAQPRARSDAAFAKHATPLRRDWAERLEALLTFRLERDARAEFRRGDVVYVDPERSPRPGDHVLATIGATDRSEGLLGLLRDATDGEWIIELERGVVVKIPRDDGTSLWPILAKAYGRP